MWHGKHYLKQAGQAHPGLELSNPSTEQQANSNASIQLKPGLRQALRISRVKGDKLSAWDRDSRLSCDSDWGWIINSDTKPDPNPCPQIKTWLVPNRIHANTAPGPTPQRLCGQTIVPTLHKDLTLTSLLTPDPRLPPSLGETWL